MAGSVHGVVDSALFWAPGTVKSGPNGGFGRFSPDFLQIGIWLTDSRWAMGNFES